MLVHPRLSARSIVASAEPSGSLRALLLACRDLPLPLRLRHGREGGHPSAERAKPTSSNRNAWSLTFPARARTTGSHGKGLPMVIRNGSRRLLARSSLPSQPASDHAPLGAASYAASMIGPRRRGVTLERRLPGTIEDVWHFLAHDGWPTLFGSAQYLSAFTAQAQILRYEPPSALTVLWRADREIGTLHQRSDAVVTLTLAQVRSSVCLTMTIFPPPGPEVRCDA